MVDGLPLILPLGHDDLTILGIIRHLSKSLQVGGIPAVFRSVAALQQIGVTGLHIRAEPPFQKAPRLFAPLRVFQDHTGIGCRRLIAEDRTVLLFGAGSQSNAPLAGQLRCGDLQLHIGAEGRNADRHLAAAEAVIKAGQRGVHPIDLIQIGHLLHRINEAIGIE